MSIKYKLFAVFFALKKKVKREVQYVMKNKKIKLREQRNNNSIVSCNNNIINNTGRNQYTGTRWRTWTNNQNENSKRRK